MLKILSCPNCGKTFKCTYEMEDNDDENFVFCMYCKKGFLISKEGIHTFHTKIIFDPFKNILK